MKYIFSLFIIVGISSCVMKDNPQEQQIASDVSEQLVIQLIELWEKADTLKTRDIFLKNCEYADVANNNTFSGIEGVNKYISHIHQWASNVKMEIRKINVSSAMGYVEWTMTAKHTSPIEGMVLIATNKPIRLNGATLLEFEDNKIKKASDYMDVLGFVIQLGSKVELPGGVTIGQ